MFLNSLSFDYMVSTILICSIYNIYIYIYIYITQNIIAYIASIIHL